VEPGLPNTFCDTHHLHASMMGIAKALHPSYNPALASGEELTPRNLGTRFSFIAKHAAHRLV
jgi:hypothetical protein